MAEQITIQVTENKIINVSDVLGNLKIADAAPTAQGLYILSDVGTYTNLGGLVTTTGKINYAYFDGTVWSLFSAQIPNYSVNTTLNPTDNTKGSSDKAVDTYVNYLIGNGLIKDNLALMPVRRYTGTTTFSDYAAGYNQTLSNGEIYINYPSGGSGGDTIWFNSLKAISNLNQKIVISSTFKGLNSSDGKIGIGYLKDGIYTGYTLSLLNRVVRKHINRAETLLQSTILTAIAVDSVIKFELFQNKLEIFINGVFFYSLTDADFEGSVLQFVHLGQFKVDNKIELFNNAFYKRINNEITYPKMFVELIPVSETYANTLFSQTVAKIYEHIKDNVYACHFLKYQHLEYADFVSGDFHGGKVVHYAGAKKAIYNKADGTMTELSSELIINQESEFVLSVGSWSSGIHGNEIFSEVLFVVDGKIHNPNGLLDFQSLPLTQCNNFFYTQKSVLHKDSDKTLLANKFKTNTFKDGGYKVDVKLEMKQSLSILFYVGIVCVAKYFSTLITDFGGKLTPSGGNAFILNGDKKVRTIYYTSPDIECKVTNEIKGSNDAIADVLLWDRSTDTKYYRRLNGYTPTVDELLEFSTTVTFN